MSGHTKAAATTLSESNKASKERQKKEKGNQCVKYQSGTLEQGQFGLTRAAC